MNCFGGCLLAAACVEQETDLRPSVGPAAYIGPDGRHNRKPRLTPLETKSPWPKTERLKVKVLPEHTLGLQLKPHNEFERTFSSPCPVKYGAKKRLGGLELAEEEIPEPGPGSHEMAEAFDAIAETRTLRSKGVPGLNSAAKRFALLPTEKEAALNPPPGAYPKPAPRVGKRKQAKAGGKGKPARDPILAPVHLAPKNPAYEWQREEKAGRASPTYITKRTFPLLSDFDRSRVQETIGIKRGFNMPEGPGLYWSKEREADSTNRAGVNPYVGKGGPAANMESKLGTAAFLSPRRGQVGPRAKLQEALQLRSAPDNHFSLQKEKLRWRQSGRGRGGFGASYARNNDRFTDWKTGERPMSISPTLSRKHYNDSQAAEAANSAKMKELLGFDPAENFYEAMASLEITRNPSDLGAAR
eukprot:COSAG02_NODE_3501_length_6648_cov_3.862269_4_plen_414_part_00